MKQFIKKYYILCLIACALPIVSLYAYTQSARTEAQVEFKVGEGPTSPVNPDNPDIDGNGEVEGSFLIVDVSDFGFGAVEIKASTQWLDIETTKPNIQVVDLRGSDNGWRVSAKVTPFTSLITGNSSLPGSAIHIYNGHPNSKSVSDAPEQIKNVMLTTDDEPFKVITAAKGAGLGLWVMRWYPETAGPAYVQLEIPAGSATVGSHTAEINWILEDGPSE